MTNLNTLLNTAKNLKVVGYSSLWNFHGSNHLDNLAKKKGTNLNNSIESLKKQGKKGAFTIYVSQIGRSQHSKSEVVILEGLTNSSEIGSSYYTKRMGEIFI